MEKESEIFGHLDRWPRPLPDPSQPIGARRDVYHHARDFTVVPDLVIEVCVSPQRGDGRGEG